nr:hypothetical protein Itr_chr13CG07670 [Ipomoea trifida]GMD74431.1 hypothetical protein Iba_chr13aCG5210 [Ipomoea batatas]
MTELAFPFLLLPAPLITAGGGGGGAKEMLRIELSLSSNANALFFLLGIASMELLLTETSSYDMRVLRSLFMRRRTALGLALWRRLSSCIRSLTPTADELICLYNGMLLIELSSNATPMFNIPCGRPDFRRT